MTINKKLDISKIVLSNAKTKTTKEGLTLEEVKKIAKSIGITLSYMVNKKRKQKTKNQLIDEINKSKIIKADIGNNILTNKQNFNIYLNDLKEVVKKRKYT